MNNIKKEIACYYITKDGNQVFLDSSFNEITGYTNILELSKSSYLRLDLENSLEKSDMVIMSRSKNIKLHKKIRDIDYKTFYIKDFFTINFSKEKDFYITSRYFSITFQEIELKNVLLKIPESAFIFNYMYINTDFVDSSKISFKKFKLKNGQERASVMCFYTNNDSVRFSCTLEEYTLFKQLFSNKRRDAFLEKCEDK